jgi:hypothetical protein
VKFHFFARGLAPYLTAYLLVVSLGLPLHKVYCACKGESEVSLLMATEHNCGHAVADDSSRLQRSKEVKKSSKKTSSSGCCSDQSSSSCSASADSTHDCGGKETTIAKLTADYLFEQEKSWVAGVNFSAPLPVIFDFNLPTGPTSLKELPIRGPTPPPLPYGRELLLRHQSFLC